jgi:imidazole glycerol-phosphate synthase subunit HisH
MKVAIIDYKMGNLHSVKAACDKVGLASIISSDPYEINDCIAAILPGVGSFPQAMKNIYELKLDNCIYRFVEKGKILFGICLGMQLLFDISNEFGINNGLGIIKGRAVKFNFSSKKSRLYPIPQIGWNRIYEKHIIWKDTILNNIKNGDFMYFLHSNYVLPLNKNIILSKTIYGNNEFCSSLKQNNIFATQFHPEKSGRTGLNIYQNLKVLIKNNSHKTIGE